MQPPHTDGYGQQKQQQFLWPFNTPQETREPVHPPPSAPWTPHSYSQLSGSTQPNQMPGAPPGPWYPQMNITPFQPPHSPSFNSRQWNDGSATRGSPVSTPAPQFFGGDFAQIQNPLMPSSAPKRALIIGCNYPGTDDELKSCVNDAFDIKEMLQNNFNYNAEDIRILVDVPSPGCSSLSPTRLNIIKHMKWLINGAKPGDSLFFHFSGHGTESLDYSGDERYNQCLLPTDYQHSGVLVDDDINRFLIRPLPEGCTLHALVDCCHSGTIMDLQFEATKNGTWDNHRPSTYKGTSGGTVFQFAACQDKKKAFGQEDNLEGEKCFGAATTAFISAINSSSSYQPLTYAYVLSHMNDRVKAFSEQAASEPGVKFGFKQRVRRVLKGLYQKPQLSSNTNTISLDTIFQL